MELESHKNYKVVTEHLKNVVDQIDLIVKQTESLPQNLSHASKDNKKDALDNWNILIGTLANSVITNIKTFISLVAICTKEYQKELEYDSATLSSSPTVMEASYVSFKPGKTVQSGSERKKGENKGHGISLTETPLVGEELKEFRIAEPALKLPEESPDFQEPKKGNKSISHSVQIQTQNPSSNLQATFQQPVNQPVQSEDHGEKQKYRLLYNTLAELKNQQGQLQGQTVPHQNIPQHPNRPGLLQSLIENETAHDEPVQNPYRKDESQGFHLVMNEAKEPFPQRPSGDQNSMQIFPMEGSEVNMVQLPAQQHSQVINTPAGMVLSSSDGLPKMRSNDSVQVAESDGDWEWRKYGQKNLKDHERYRSYFRCAEKTCPAKKVVDFRHLDHRIISTQLMMEHNHLKPTKSQKVRLVFSNREKLSGPEGRHYLVQVPTPQIPQPPGNGPPEVTMLHAGSDGKYYVVPQHQFLQYSLLGGLNPGVQGQSQGLRAREATGESSLGKERAKSGESSESGDLPEKSTGKDSGESEEA